MPYPKRTQEGETKVCEVCKHYQYLDLYETWVCMVNVRENQRVKRYERVFRPWEMNCGKWKEREQ